MGSLKHGGSQYLLTAAHNVRDARSIEILYRGTAYRTDLLAADGKTDLAVLRLDDRYTFSCTNLAGNLPTVGSVVQAFGYPLGRSNLYRRERQILSADGRAIRTLGGWEKGNSGGALSFDGRVVGLISRVEIPNRMHRIPGIGLQMREPSTQEYLDGTGVAVPIGVIRAFLTQVLGAVPRCDHPAPAQKPPEVKTPPVAGPQKTTKSIPRSADKPVAAVPHTAASPAEHSVAKIAWSLVGKSGVAWTLGPVAGAAITLGVPFFYRRLRRKRRPPPVVREVPKPFAVPVDSPPLPPEVIHSTRYEPYPVNDFREAFGWAEIEYVRKFPGSVDTLETLKSMISQYLSSKGKKG